MRGELTGLRTTGRGYGCAFVVWLGALVGALFLALERQLSATATLALLVPLVVVTGLALRRLFVDAVTLRFDAAGLRLERRALFGERTQQLPWSGLRGATASLARGRYGVPTHAVLTLATVPHGTVYLSTSVARFDELARCAQQLEAALQAAG